MARDIFVVSAAEIGNERIFSDAVNVINLN